MMTKYTFSLKNNPSTFHAPKYKSTGYSKILDDLIAADIKDKNLWLYGTTANSCAGCPFSNCSQKIKINIKTKDPLEDIFAWGNTNYSYNTAYNFLAGLDTYCPFEKDVKYKLSTGDIITITDDYIHINDKMYFFNLMDNDFFYNLSAKMKKTIAIIYIAGLKITIKK